MYRALTLATIGFKAKETCGEKSWNLFTRQIIKKRPSLFIHTVNKLVHRLFTLFTDTLFQFLDGFLQDRVAGHIGNNFVTGVQNCGMVPATELVANLRQGQIG